MKKKKTSVPDPTPTIESLVGTLKKETLNPFLLTGVQPYIVRSLPEQVLKEYLRKQLQLVQRYTHPDATNNNPTLTFYFKEVTNNITALLSDDFTFKRRLKEFTSGDIV